MAPPTTKPSPKRKPPAFNPPRPSKPSKSTKKPTPTPRRKSAPAKHSAISSDEASMSNPEPSYLSPSPPAPPPIISTSSKTALPEDEPPTIPPQLLTRLLHHHFTSQKTRIGKDANGVVGKYMEIFVREAIARAVFERGEKIREGGGVGAGGVGEEFLDVEDLEKLAPQLLLDF